MMCRSRLSTLLITSALLQPTFGCVKGTIRWTVGSGLSFTGPATTKITGCNKYVITAVPFESQPSPVSSPTTVNLTASGSGNFYSDSHCLNSASTVTIATGTSSVPVYFLDLNTENILLIASTSKYGLANLNISVTGLFGSAVNYPTPQSNGVAIRIADANRDGYPDIFVSTLIGPEVGYYQNYGNGTFATGTTIMLSGQSQSFSLVDINGDGFLDLVTFQNGGSQVVSFKGDGDGTFSSTLSTQSVGIAFFGGAVADFNNDGNPDYVIVNNTATAQAFLGNGSGNFSPQTAVSTGASTNPNSVRAVDINGDGKMDLVIVDDSAAGQVITMFGTGSGGFTLGPAYATGTLPYDVAIGDFNGDGVPDFVSADQGANQLSVAINNGSGSFSSPTPYAICSASTPHAVAVADFNGDGYLDIAVANFGSNSVTLCAGRGDGSFFFAGTLGVGVDPTGVAFADLNGDGKTDLAVSNFGSSYFSIFLAQ